MALGSGIVGQGGAVLLYRSPDLVSWEYVGPLLVGDVAEQDTTWECPSLFPIGDRHVLIVSLLPGARSIYFVGRYADHVFTPEWEGVVDHGGSYYAPQVMVDDSGRRLMFGWAWEGRSDEAQRAAGWAGVQALPRTLSLTSDGQLVSRPAEELAALRSEHVRIGQIELASGGDHALEVQGDCLELLAKFQVGRGKCGLKLLCGPDGSEETLVGYDRAAGCVFVDRERASLGEDVQRDVQRGELELAEGETLRLHVFVDRSMVEVFANGVCCLTSRVYATRSDSRGVAVFGDEALLYSLDVWRMRPIWPSEGSEA
jgi:beta-fructofuranosidase